MGRTRGARALVLAGAGLAALGLFAGVAAGQSVNRAAIDELNEQLLYVALPLTVFVELTLVYAVYRFRDNDDPRPTTDDPALEITWTAATGAILLFVGLSGFFVLLNPYITPAAAGAGVGAGGEAAGADAAADPVEIEVLAYQWGWEFHYPEANVTSDDRLVVPVDRDVRFTLRSADVIHSIFVPELGVKQDVFPGQTTVARTRATETGEYNLYCAELCGAGHSKMDATVVVTDGASYRAWLADGGNATAASAAARPGPDVAG